MLRTEVIIGVKDVKKSSEWYRQLLNCISKHGGDTFEILADEDDTVILCLHKWGEHDHPTMTDTRVQPGNGLILYFRVSELDKIWENAKRLNVHVEAPPHLNTNSGQQEFSLRDMDGYYITISL
ncbi:VOC family protein [Chitinophaga sp. MM2321]|uniref:VOC family protein n=1 Tax=Chitinophaga sp. MM2321 TaxID=3137178 RepID=UPI0032D5A696